MQAYKDSSHCTRRKVTAGSAADNSSSSLQLLLLHHLARDLMPEPMTPTAPKAAVSSQHSTQSEKQNITRVAAAPPVKARLQPQSAGINKEPECFHSPEGPAPPLHHPRNHQTRRNPALLCSVGLQALCHGAQASIMPCSPSLKPCSPAAGYASEALQAPAAHNSTNQP